MDQAWRGSEDEGGESDTFHPAYVARQPMNGKALSA
jgi:hypothetical protein